MWRGIEASWLWSGDVLDVPLAGGAVVVDHTRVMDVGEGPTLRARHPDARWERHEGVLMPGLVNARVRLELSALRERVAGGQGYVPWLRERTDILERETPEADLESIERALTELIWSGTAAIGEVTGTGAAIETLSGAPLIARVFHEVAGLRRETATVLRAMAEEQHEAVRVPKNVTLALAPHSLVGLHPSALVALFEGALPIPLPLAWSSAERAFLADGGGPIGAWMRERGADPADWAPPALSPIVYAEALGVVGPGLVATHLTDASASELGSLAAQGAHAVLCPRASLHVEGALPPLPMILDAGLWPGLGSGSLAAAPSLDVLEDALALHRRFPSIEPRMLCAMATSFGARALGLTHRVGRLAPGLAPGVLLFEGEGVRDPLAHVLAQAGRPRRVLVHPGGEA